MALKVVVVLGKQYCLPERRQPYYILRSSAHIKLFTFKLDLNQYNDGATALACY